MIKYMTWILRILIILICVPFLLLVGVICFGVMSPIFLAYVLYNIGRWAFIGEWDW